MPIDTKLRKKHNYHYLNEHDIHWRNTALLANYLNFAGLMKNRIATGLPKPQQKKIKNAVIMAKVMKLLPSAGFVKSFHKHPLKDMYEELEESAVQNVDLQTGAIRLEEPEQNWVDRSMDIEEIKEKLESYNEEYFFYNSKY